MWYPARPVSTVPSVYSVGGCHESVTVSPATCALEPAEEFEELALADPESEDGLEQDEPDARKTAGSPADPEILVPTMPVPADVELELPEDDPLPHAVSIPASINEPATNSVHEPTPVLIMTSPPSNNSVSSATRATQRYASNGFRP